MHCLLDPSRWLLTAVIPRKETYASLRPIRDVAATLEKMRASGCVRIFARL
jgi:hypothetical protein